MTTVFSNFSFTFELRFANQVLDIIESIRLDRVKVDWDNKTSSGSKILITAMDVLLTRPTIATFLTNEFNYELFQKFDVFFWDAVVLRIWHNEQAMGSAPKKKCFFLLLSGKKWGNASKQANVLSQ